MAGDWIKMRTDLVDDPAVILIATACGIDEDAVIGKLHRLWSWADRHTTDGMAPGIGAAWVDRYVACQGFAAAMAESGWLVIGDKAIQFPGFDKHNGESAKRRADNALRQRLSRANRDNGVTGNERDTIPRPFRKVVFVRDSYTCVYCGTQSTEAQEASRKAVLSVDHLKPISRGGRTAVDNLACCCKLCNNEKNDRTPEEWGVLPTFLQDGVTYVTGSLRGGVTETLPREEKSREKRECDKSHSLAASPRVKFQPPELEEVAEFCRNRNNGIDAEAFVAFYASKGWVVGKQPMKDWRAAVITWEKSRKERGDAQPANAPPRKPEPQYPQLVPNPRLIER